MMAKSKNQKGKILYVERLLYDTGENRLVSMQDILTYLTDQGILAERKSIYDDLSLLRTLGMDIRYRHGKPGGYYQAGVRPDSLLGEIARLSHQTPAQSPENVTSPAEGNPDPASTYEAGEGEVKQVRLAYGTEEGQRLLQEYLGFLPESREKQDGVTFVNAEISDSEAFYGWLTAVGREVRLVKPKKMVQSYREYLKYLVKEYKLQSMDS